MINTQDIKTLNLADADRAAGIRGLIRTGRRLLKRCWLDQETIQRPRVFCQNSGGCGSTFLIRLLESNSVDRVFHEKTPDLYQLGLDHFEAPISTARLVRILRYTRHDVFVEANNRLFSMTPQIATAFPNANFIHLHRDGTEAVRSAMSKPNIEQYLKTHSRFQGSLAGPKDATPFERFCHHWANMNRRISEDLATIPKTGKQSVFEIRFEDLIQGKIEPLENAMKQKLSRKTRPPANVGRLNQQGKFPEYSDWSSQQKDRFQKICGPVMSMLGR